MKSTDTDASSTTPPAKKAKTVRTSPLSFKVPEPIAEQNLPCMYFPGRHGKRKSPGTHVVPLFPQFIAYYNEVKLPMMWIDVSPSAQWILAAVKIVEGANQRDTTRKIVEQLQADIKQGIHAARGIEDSNIDEKVEGTGRDHLRKMPTVDMKIDGAKVACLNALNKFYISSDTNATKLLQTRIATACDIAARKDCEGSPTDTGTEASEVASPASGRYKYANTTPNLRSRCWWNSAKSAFILDVKKLAKNKSKPHPLQFAVPMTLTGIEYENARERQYHNAAVCWNDIDGSGRERIDMAKILKQLNAWPRDA